MLSRHYVRMACNNAWSNHRLLRACMRLSPEAFAATRTSFFPSIVATLNHVLTVDWYYVDALERWQHRREVNRAPWRFYEPEVPFADAHALHAAQRLCDDRLVALCEALDDARLDEGVALMRRAGQQHEPAHRLLDHLLQHQIHHRGQAHAMLAGTDVAPPPLDEFYCANEAQLRAKELAEIGLSEERVWGNAAMGDRR
ncbi:MAG: DinB family protein [Betaproteobacteria bacterium]